MAPAIDNPKAASGHPVHRPSIASAVERRTARWLAAMTVAVIAAVAPSTTSAQDNAQQQKQLRQMRDQQYKSVERMVASMRPLDAKRIDDVFRVTVVDGRLTCEIPAALRKAGSGSQFRVNVPELPGPTYVQRFQAFRANGLGNNPKGEKPMSFSLQCTLRPDDDTLVNLSITSQPEIFQISKSSQTGVGRFSSIQLVEQAGVFGPAGIELRAFDQQDDGTGQAAVNIAATDFETLRREYPREVDRHLRPLLRELGQEHLLAPDPRLAWQVLNEYWPTDPAVQAKVIALVPGLSDPDFRRREQVMGELIALGRPGAAAMLRMSRTDLTPDATVMIARAVSEYRQVSDRVAVKLRTDRGFLLDCLLVEDAEIRQAAFSQLRKVTERADLPFDPDAAAPVRSIAVRELRSSLGLGPPARPSTQPSTKPSSTPSTTQPAAVAPPAVPRDPKAR